jgi:flavin reductase (DIM6/NTAB) family NADH-FMN oxidoreductase RutF
MQLDFSQLDAAESYRWLSSTVTPRPIAWVSTVSANGITNLAPFSFFQVICDDPATLMVNVGLRANGELKDTLRNAQDTGELVIHLVSKAESEHMNATAATLPRIAAASVAFECTLAEVIPYPAEHPRQFLIFARVLLAHIDDAVMADARHIDPAKLDLVGRLSGSWYSTTRDRFAMKRPA